MAPRPAREARRAMPKTTACETFAALLAAAPASTPFMDLPRGQWPEKPHKAASSKTGTAIQPMTMSQPRQAKPPDSGRFARLGCELRGLLFRLAHQRGRARSRPDSGRFVGWQRALAAGLPIARRRRTAPQFLRFLTIGNTPRTSHRSALWAVLFGSTPDVGACSEHRARRRRALCHRACCVRASARARGSFEATHERL